MKIPVLIGTMTMLVLTQPAGAACHIKYSSVAACLFDETGRNAAEVYQQLGRDSARMRISNVRELLHEANCFVISDDPAHPTYFPFKHGSRRIATADGWINVDFMSDGKKAFFIADDYISGICDRPPPPTSCKLGDPCNPGDGTIAGR